ncbi:tRNA (guanosine(37)-N1)-methyltransferase TrmD [Anaerofustis stercorihominis]|uniref:tRNA (guanosine(37)-N1)-methyltransferase TrmD n=1 Tax=Anaerofustis stercorihominis TaxID=214853 RepID=UPI00214CF523|nr:tRNA (guanosine(37)-N1)-methyltransferase TrmD [Anaerofustis stercorihominis]MCR2031998.1 tRNA (guanosine(37)-N1)-methyltransferase TrmD [Anaerofustis stercorihominis]
MIFNVLTLYPEMIEAYKEIGIIGRGVNSGKLQINAVNIRDYSKDKHRRVDDEIYGGGAGMLMKAEPVYDCVKDIKKNRDVPVIYFSPRGKIFNSELAKKYADLDEVILLCGHYEGIDQRVVDLCVDEEISIGDYILTGGHIASMVFIDTVSRYVTGVLGNSESYQKESFEDGLLEASQYTRPEEFMGMKVPEVLLSGHHKKIEEYYKDEALKETKKRREDLL